MWSFYRIGERSQGYCCRALAAIPLDSEGLGQAPISEIWGRLCQTVARALHLLCTEKMRNIHEHTLNPRKIRQHFYENSLTSWFELLMSGTSSRLSWCAMLDLIDRLPLFLLSTLESRSGPGLSRIGLICLRSETELKARNFAWLRRSLLRYLSSHD